MQLHAGCAEQAQPRVLQLCLDCPCENSAGKMVGDWAADAVADPCADPDHHAENNVGDPCAGPDHHVENYVVVAVAAAAAAVPAQADAEADIVFSNLHCHQSSEHPEISAVLC